MSRRAAAAFSAVVVLATLSAAADPPRNDAFGDALPDGARARLGTGRWRLSSYSRGAVLSADGKTIIVPDRKGRLLVDVQTGRSTATSASPLFIGVEIVLVSRDGQTLIECRSESFFVWDAESGQMTKKFTRERHALAESYALSDDGKYLVCFPRIIDESRGAPTVTVWEVASGKPVASVEPLKSREIQAVLSRDGTLLATFAEMVQVWDVATGKEKHRIATRDHGASAARFSPDGKLLATSSLAGSIELWDVASGKKLRSFGAGKGQGGRLFFSPDAKRLAAGAADGTIQVWETATARRLTICEPVCPTVLDIVFPALGPALALGARNQALLVWSVPDRRRLTPEIGHTTPPTALQFAGGGKSLLSFDESGRILRWTLAAANKSPAKQDQPAEQYVRAHEKPPYRNAEFSPGGRWLALSGRSGQRMLLATNSGTELYTFSPATADTGTNARPTFFANESHVAEVSRLRDPTSNLSRCVVHIWEAETGKLVREIPIPWLNMSHPSSSCALSPNGARLVVSGLSPSDKAGSQIMVEAFDVASGKSLQRYVCRTRGAEFPPVVSPDGRSVFVPAPNGQAAIWDMVSGNTLRSVILPGPVWKVAPRIAPSGRFVVVPLVKRSQPTRKRTTGRLETLVVLEWPTGDIRAELPLPNDVSVTSLAISPNGKTIAAGCSDTSILLYDPALLIGDNRSEKRTPDELWKRLGSSNAADAWRAACELHSRPEIALPLLRQRIRPAKSSEKPDSAAIVKWIGQLDAPQFNDREAAEQQLLQHAGLAAEAVRAALKNNPSAEANKRLSRIVAVLDKPQQLEVIDARALEILENCGSADARSFLAELATGDPGAILTREAKLALTRMSNGPAK